MEFPSEKGAARFGLRLLRQIRLDRSELGGQLGSHAVDGRNDHDGDAGGDQAVFDRGGTGFVGDEPRANVAQVRSPWGLRWMAQPSGR